MLEKYFCNYMYGGTCLDWKIMGLRETTVKSNIGEVVV